MTTHQSPWPPAPPAGGHGFSRNLFAAESLPIKLQRNIGRHHGGKGRRTDKRY